MIFTDLDASGYNYNFSFYNAEFEEILSKVIQCYHLMINNGVTLTNDENKIRDVLLIDYLKNNRVRRKIGLVNFLFDREVPEDNTVGRTDIKIQTLNTFIDTGAYYTIECKRLDVVNQAGKTGLNGKYIENGISRFVNGTYSSYYKTNGMIGFIVQEMNVQENISHLNVLLSNSFKNCNTTTELTKRSILDGFDFCYHSVHTVGSNANSVYHLMFDFSANIE